MELSKNKFSKDFNVILIVISINKKSIVKNIIYFKSIVNSDDLNRIYLIIFNQVINKLFELSESSLNLTLSVDSCLQYLTASKSFVSKYQNINKFIF